MIHAFHHWSQQATPAWAIDLRRVALGLVSCVLATSACALDGDATAYLQRIAGTYAVDYRNASAARLSVSARELVIAKGGRQMSEKTSQVDLFLYGNRPPDDYEATLMGKATVMFDVFADKRGRYLKLDDTPALKAWLGPQADAAKYRDCDPKRKP